MSALPVALNQDEDGQPLCRFGLPITDAQLEAAALYLVHGEIGPIARAVHMPPITVETWTQSAWWQDALEHAKARQRDRLDAKLSNVIDLAVDAVQERLTNGDEIALGGELIRRKVSAKDAAVIAAVAIEKRQIIRGELSTSSANDPKLQQLAEVLRKYAADNAKVIDQT